MADRDPEKQSSVLFSLRELMSLEEERIKTEKEQEEEARAAERRTKMEAELRLRAAEEARIRAEEERRRADQQREREEAAHLAAIQAAAIEKARLEAQEEARLQAMELAHKHERDIQVLRADKDKIKLRRALTVVALASIVAATGGLGFYFGVVVPRAEQERAAAEAEALRLKNDRDKAAAEAAAKEKLIADLTTQRDKAVTEKERAELDVQLAKLKGDDKKPVVGGPGPGPGPRSGKDKDKGGQTDAEKLLDACKNSKDPACGL